MNPTAPGGARLASTTGPAAAHISALTHAVVVLAACGAIAVPAIAALGFDSLPFLCITALVLTFTLSKLSPWGTWLALLPVYLSPVLFVLWRGGHHYSFTLVWMSGVLGVVLSGGLTRAWSLPPAWQWPLVYWALAIAASFPITAWRELDFTFPLVWDSRLPVANGRQSAPGSAAWTAYVALGHLLGILWIDWLFRRYSVEDRTKFVREIVLPLACGIVLACTIGVYQGFADMAFLSGHVWPSLHRAAGTFMDANVFGMVAALWAPVFLVLGLNQGGAAGIGAAGFALAWGGVWMSGSRTALLAASIGTLLAALELRHHVGTLSIGARRAWLATTVTTTVLLAVLLSALPSLNVTAINRTGHLLPGLRLNAIARTAYALLWERDGYGTAAVAMVKEFPWLGVGVGTYHTIIYDYAREVPGVFIAADNAQNWFRHQLAELGLLGSVGWIAWIAVFAVTLWPGRKGAAGPAAALRGPLIGFGLASLLGVPGQEPAVIVTFWVLVFWYSTETGTTRAAATAGTKAGWIAILVLAAVYSAWRAVPDDLRPPFRAARFHFNYTYGFDFSDPDTVRTAGRGVHVMNAATRWLKLTYWVEHPDADQRPVRVDLSVDRSRIEHRRLPRVPVTRYVRVGEEWDRVVLRVDVDRTFRDVSGVERGLAMKWEFVPNRP